MKNNRKGFTLIELLVVVAVIGILASVVLLGLGQVRGRGRDARRIADLKQLQNGLELYFNTCNRYPAHLTGLTNGSDATCADGTPAGATVNQQLFDPSSNGTIMYDYCVGGINNNRYILGAMLEDPTNPVLNQMATWSSAGICAGEPLQNGGSGAARACQNGAAPGSYCVTI